VPAADLAQRGREKIAQTVKGKFVTREQSDGLEGETEKPTMFRFKTPFMVLALGLIAPRSAKIPHV
jgi:hypothetical protein